MNLTQVLRTALPDLPPQRRPDRPPRIHPDLIVREHLEREGVFVRCIIPSGKTYYRLTKEQYLVAALFDGQRSYSEVASLCESRLRLAITEDELRQFADIMEQGEFWYRTQQEQSVILAHELAEQRHKVIRHKAKHFDPTTIELWYFDPAKMLDWLHERLRWMYSTWFFVWTLVMIGVMVVIFGSHASMLWNDTVYFYNLPAQGVVHVFEFFGIFFVLAAIHESAHGMGCHHYGGKSHRMGFFLMYMVPGAFCDAAESFVRAGRWGRIVTIASGLWSEVILCSYLSVLWWLTPPGTTVHNLAYIFILSGGILAVLINWNPLSRMDGYFIFCEIFNFHDLKGNSTSYLVNVVRKYAFRLPATVPALPPLRRIGFVTYALLSGIYCYSLLATFCKITYRVLLHYWPLWAWLPASLLGVLIFRSRIIKLAKFFRELYLDKKAIMKKNWKTVAPAAAVVLVLLLLPLRREYAEEQFMLEPVERAVLRTEVPGRVVQVLADEGSHVPTGGTVVRMRDLGLETQLAKAQANLQASQARAFQAQLRYADFATEEQQRRNAETACRLAQDQTSKLEVRSPVAGVVVTPRVQDKLGAYLAAGVEIAEVANTSELRARVYVPEPQMRKLQSITGNSLLVDGFVAARHGKVASISPSSRELAAGMDAPPKYAGVREPVFFTVDVLLTNQNGELRPGMGGIAKIYGRRRSLLASVMEPFVDAVARRLW